MRSGVMTDQSLAVYAANSSLPLAHVYLGEEVDCVIRDGLGLNVEVEMRAQNKVVKLYSGKASESSFNMFITSLGTHIIIINVMDLKEQRIEKTLYQKLHVVAPLSLKIKTIDDFYYGNVIIEAVLENASKEEFLIACSLIRPNSNPTISEEDETKEITIKPSFRLHRTFIVPFNDESLGQLNITFKSIKGPRGRLKTGGIIHQADQANKSLVLFAQLVYSSEREGILRIHIRNQVKEPLDECEFQIINSGLIVPLEALLNHHYIHRIEQAYTFDMKVLIKSSEFSEAYNLRARMSYLNSSGDPVLKQLDTQLLIADKRIL